MNAVQIARKRIRRQIRSAKRRLVMLRTQRKRTIHRLNRVVAGRAPVKRSQRPHRHGKGLT